MANGIKSGTMSPAVISPKALTCGSSLVARPASHKRGRSSSIRRTFSGSSATTRDHLPLKITSRAKRWGTTPILGFPGYRAAPGFLFGLVGSAADCFLHPGFLDDEPCMMSKKSVPYGRRVAYYLVGPR